MVIQWGVSTVAAELHAACRSTFQVMQAHYYYYIVHTIF